ncbi:MAG: phage virion morphogenesis protein [Methylovulum sp.]|uniref:phage virion morphogenesis protein n=1 Tax=Methylovulum sp. TaxID=1916980 RepID=UPI002602AD0F|nr:phage virion morphogenesis protein [Methylovulum sp.]MDD2725400.1 phage virion morphogenesis protein [Methylovulum sp.]MDD5124351.1 phage virion morphogenesis protein [Methylovulum sp.]
MTAVTIDLNDQAIINALRQLTYSANHLEPALEEIGAAVRASIDLNFTGQHDPNGNPWEPLSEATLLNRTSGSGQILRDMGLLNRSITYNVKAESVEIGSMSVVDGTNLKYANMMQSGGKKTDFPWLWGDIPERPFVGVSEADKVQILAILSGYLERSIG